MKRLPLAVILSCAALLPGCGRPGASTSESDQQAEERIEKEEAHQLSLLHEREATLDERERLLAQREQKLAPVAVPSPAPVAETRQPAQPTPAPVAPSTPIPIAAPTPPVPSPDATYQSFYDALSPYGSWVQIPGYEGYLWQPSATVRNPSWRPYTVGHWVYTDEGWTWVSDEPFGWIAYHYGRWMRTRTLGWVWMPGDQWAPAWVSWRYGDDYVGWAPLPPGAQFNGATGIQQWADDQYSLGPSDYTFVPASAFGDDNMAGDEAPPDQTDAIYDDSNNITNIYYDTGAYAIICYGPNYEFMRSKSNRPLLPPYTLRRGGYRPGGLNGAIFSGKTLEVPAPRIVRKTSPAAPQSVRGIVVDTRLVAERHAPPAPGARNLPLSQPPRQAAGAPIAPHLNPAPAPRPAAGFATQPAPPRPTPSGATAGTRNLVPTNPAPPPAGAQAQVQEERDLQIIQQQQAERERRVAEAARIAAEEQSAAEAARAQRATDEAAEKAATAKAARDQAASRQAQVPHAGQSSQTSHSSQPSSVPAGTQPPGHGQQ